MPRRQVSARSRIPLAAARVYSLIADYRDGHPRILPAAYFKGLEVEQGGIGAGTIIRYEVRLFGATRTARASISEPEPGRMLAETDLSNGTVTTFSVAPAGDAACDVTITTDFPVHGGVLGRLEQWAVGRTLRPIFDAELRQLASVATHP